MACAKEPEVINSSEPTFLLDGQESTAEQRLLRANRDFAARECVLKGRRCWSGYQLRSDINILGERDETKYNRDARSPITIDHVWCFVVAEASELAEVAIGAALAHHLEEEEPLSVVFVRQHRPITRRKRHVAALSLAKVMEDSVVVPEIVVAVRFAGLASEDEDIGLIGRGRNAALSLTAESSVNVVPSAVQRADRKLAELASNDLHAPRVSGRALEFQAKSPGRIRHLKGTTDS